MRQRLGAEAGGGPAGRRRRWSSWPGRRARRSTRPSRACRPAASPTSTPPARRWPTCSGRWRCATSTPPASRRSGPPAPTLRLARGARGGRGAGRAVPRRHRPGTRRRCGPRRQQVKEAAPRIARIRERLRKLTPDPQQAMTPGDRQKLDRAGREAAGAGAAGRRAAAEARPLAEKAPIFPPQAAGAAGREPRPHGVGRRRAAGAQPAARPRRAGGGAGAARRVQEGARADGQAGEGRPGRRLPVPVRRDRRGRRARG